MDSYAAQLEALNRTASLGAPVAPPAELAPLPLKYFMGSVLLVVLGALLVASAAFVGEEPGAQLGLVLTGAPFLVFGGALLVRRALSGARLEALEHGVTLTRRGRTRSLAYEEVDTIELDEREQLNNGVREGVVAKLRLSGGGVKLAATHFARDGFPHPEQAAFSEIFVRTLDTTERRVRNGLALRGRGWSLEGTGLRVGGVVVSLDDVRAAALFDGRVSLWRGTEEEPFLSTPAKGPNARLLLALAQKRIGARGAVPEAQPDGLGRVLFRRKNGWAVTIVLGAISVGALAIGGFGFVETAGEPLMAGAFVAGGVLGLVGTVGTLVSELRCHARGVVRRTLFGTRRLSYAEIEGFAFSAVRHYYNGAYTGTTLGLTFRPATGKAIRYSNQVRGNDTDLEVLRESVSEIVAAKLHARAKAGAEVPWGDALLSKSSIRFRRAKLIGKGDELTLPYAGLRFRIEDGVFLLFAPDETKAVLKIPCAAENFYPGLIAFQQLATEAAG